jgi:hypothetical protein
MFHQERLSLLGRQTSERVLDLTPNHTGLRLAFRIPVFRDEAHHGVDRNRCPLRLQKILACIGSDSKQPGPYPLRVPAFPEVSVRLDEGGLHDIFGVILASCHPLGVTIQEILIAANEFAERPI